MIGIAHAFNSRLNKKLGFDPSFDSMGMLLQINRISKVIPDNNVILAKKCYDQLIKIRADIYNYSKGSTQTEYSRCLAMLVAKLEINIGICVQNDEKHKISQFAQGEINIDQLAIKDVAKNDQENQKNIQNICELCKVGEIELIDGFKYCSKCCGIYA